MVYTFRKMFFISQNLMHVHMTYSFLELLIFFFLFLSTPKKYCLWIQTSWETNHEILIINLVKNSFFKCKIKTPFFLFFFLVGFFFFFKHSRFTGQQGKGESILLTPLYQFHSLHRRLDISRAVTAESSPLHIASSRTRNWNLWFSSASR